MLRYVSNITPRIIRPSKAQFGPSVTPSNAPFWHGRSTDSLENRRCMLSPAGSAAPVLAASRKALSAERQRLRFGYASGCLYFPHVQPELPVPPVKPERPVDAATPGARIEDRIEVRSARSKARQPIRFARLATAETPGARIEERISCRSARSKARAPPPKVRRPASAETPGARIEQRIESRARQPKPASPSQQTAPRGATAAATCASCSAGRNRCTLASAASTAVPLEVTPVPGKADSAANGHAVKPDPEGPLVLIPVWFPH